MDLKNACVTQHRVRFAGESSSADLAEMRDYMAREGRFAERDGIDRSITLSDSRLEDSRHERAADMVAYYARIGRHEGRGPENPLTPGERSGHCFCQSGLYDYRRLDEEIARSGSNVVTSVVSVRREDARELHMDSKEAFEVLLRNEWSRMAASWGIIEDPNDVRWVAFYHVDGNASLHCHVVTWDASGRWGGDDRRLIPEEPMERGVKHINEVVIKRQLDALSDERTYLRDAIAARVRYHLGREIAPERLADLEKARERVGSEHSPIPVRPLSAQKALDYVDSVRDAAPGGRVTQYGRSPEEVRQTAQSVVAKLREGDRELDAMYRRHDEVVEEHGVATWHTDRAVKDVDGRFRNDLGSYRAAARYDLDRRSASEVCTVARAMCRPWQRGSAGDAERMAARRAVTEAARGLDASEVEKARSRYAEALRASMEPTRPFRGDVWAALSRREAERVATRVADQEVFRRRTAVEADRMSREGVHDARRALMATMGRSPVVAARAGCRVVGRFDRERLAESGREWAKGRDAMRRGDEKGAEAFARNAARVVLSDDEARRRIAAEASVRHRAHPQRDVSDDLRRASELAEDRLTRDLVREYDRTGDEAGWGRVLASSVGSVVSSLARSGGGAGVSRGGSSKAAFERDRDRDGRISRALDASRDSFRGR